MPEGARVDTLRMRSMAGPAFGPSKGENRTVLEEDSADTFSSETSNRSAHAQRDWGDGGGGCEQVGLSSHTLEVVGGLRQGR